MKESGLLKLIDAATRGTINTAVKHPVAATGSVGLGIGVLNSVDPSQKAEAELMREYMGAPGAKYSSCSLMEKFAERKTVLAAKIAFEKVSRNDPPSFGQNVAQGASETVGGSIVSEGLAAIRRLIGVSSQAVSERMIKDPQRKKIINNVVKMDPVISTAERENPGQAAQAYSTMRKFAPTLSTDPNIVKSFLRNSALSGGPMDFQTIKGLADAEHAVLRAKGEGAWLKGGL